MGNSSGWNRPSAASQSVKKGGAKAPSQWCGMLAGVAVAVLVLGVVCYCMLGSSSEGPKREAEKGSRRIKTVNVVRSMVTGSSEATASNKVAQYKATVNERVREYVKKPTGTNDVNWLHPPMDPKDPDNALHQHYAQELGSLLSTEPGDQLTPFPYSFLSEDSQKEQGVESDNGNEEFIASLKRWKIVAKETDDEHRLEHKERLINAQKELLDGIDNGISVNDSIRAAYEFRKRAFEMRNTIVETLTEIADGEDDHAHTIEQIEDMNRRLDEEGIKRIAITDVIPDYVAPTQLQEEKKE